MFLAVAIVTSGLTALPPELHWPAAEGWHGLGVFRSEFGCRVVWGRGRYLLVLEVGPGFDRTFDDVLATVDGVPVRAAVEPRGALARHGDWCPTPAQTKYWTRRLVQSVRHADAR